MLMDRVLRSLLERRLAVDALDLNDDEELSVALDASVRKEDEEEFISSIR